MNKLKQFFSKDLIPFFILYFALLLLTISKPFHYDDLYFADFANVTGQARLLWFLQFRYEAWTSRIIIETVLVLFTRNFPWLWKICDPLIYCILSYGIFNIFVPNNKHNIFIAGIISCLVLLIPYHLLDSAGFIATSLNTLWPITFGIVSLFPIKKCIENKKIHFYEYPIYILSILFAANAEQVATVLFAVYIIFFVYFLLQKRLTIIVTIMLILASLSLIFILHCPRKLYKNIS